MDAPTQTPPGGQPQGLVRNSAEGEAFPLEGIKRAHTHTHIPQDPRCAKGAGRAGPLTGWPPAAWAHDGPGSCWHRPGPGACSGQRCQGQGGWPFTSLAPRPLMAAALRAPASAKPGLPPRPHPVTSGRGSWGGSADEGPAARSRRAASPSWERCFTVPKARPCLVAPQLPHGGEAVTVPACRRSGPRLREHGGLPVIVQRAHRRAAAWSPASWTGGRPALRGPLSNNVRAEPHACPGAAVASRRPEASGSRCGASPSPEAEVGEGVPAGAGGGRGPLPPRPAPAGGGRPRRVASCLHLPLPSRASAPPSPRGDTRRRVQSPRMVSPQGP